MTLSLDPLALESFGLALEHTVSYGINAGTLKADERAWDFWEEVCARLCTSPLRTAEDVRDHPERNAFLLAVLMMHAVAVCVPKNHERLFIKSRSALAYPLAIIRIFGRWGVKMPSYATLKAELSGLSRAYLAYHGPYSLAPRRAENMTFAMVKSIDRIQPGATVGRRKWDDADHDVFMFRRLNKFMIHTGFRLGEIVRHVSGEIMFLTFCRLTWLINNVVVARPTREQMRNLVAGRDKAIVAPPRTKPDQTGEIHCPFPVYLTYYDTEINPAAALRDIELRVGQHVASRETTALFCDRSNNPYSHGFMDGMLAMVLTFLYGAAVAAIYSWHSYRSGLATALHAAGVSDDMIQLICRWMCPESLLAYRRKGMREHEHCLQLAATADVTAVQTVNVPRVVGDIGFSQLLGDIANGPARGPIQREYDAAVEAAVNPFNRQLRVADSGGALEPPQAATRTRRQAPAPPAPPPAQQ